MSGPKVEALTEPLILGEGPHWDQEAQVLYYVDLLGYTVHKYNPGTRKQTCTTKIGEKNVSFVLPIQGKKNKYAVTVGPKLAVMTWDGENSTPKLDFILSIEDETSGKSFNDGKADYNGLLWTGTMGQILNGTEVEKEGGSLYSISKDYIAIPHVTKVGISNGLAWSKDMKYFYYIDTHILEVFQFDYDSSKGKISNRKSIFQFAKHGMKGSPDGMTIDTDGKLWVASFGGGEVFQLDPATGNLMERISIPAPNVTSVTFGGPNLDELFVTTASFGMSPEQQRQYPSAGALFRVTGLGVKGFPSVPVNL